MVLTLRNTDPFTRGELDALMLADGGPRISIYMPTRLAAGGPLGNAGRFKSLLQQARRGLEARGERNDRIDEIIAPAIDRLEETGFWQQQNEGLAVFIAPGSFSYFRAAVEFDEQCHVGRNFYLKPLIPAMDQGEEFFLLALNQSHVRLYRLGRHWMEAMSLGETPQSMDEFLKYDEFEKTHQGQTQTPHYMAGGDRGRIPSHGHGGGGDAAPEKAKLMDYFHVLDNAVRDAIGGDTRPLVLAGQPHLRGMYRDANKYRAIHEQDIESNPDSMEEEALHARAWELAGPYFQNSRREAIERFRTLVGRGDARVLQDPEKVVSAAAYQLVDTLFASRDEHCWGTFDADSGQVELHDGQQPDNDDLAGFAAIETLRNGGSVHVLERSLMPANVALAAITRGPTETIA